MAQSITIRIADRTYSLKVSSPEHEEVIRKAAGEINKKVKLYLDKFPGKGMIEILSFVALNVCMSNVTLQKQAQAMEEEEAALARELESYLENTDRNSR